MLIASVSVPAAAVALEHSVQPDPDIEIRAERVAAHSTEWVMPCLWVRASDFDAVDERFESDPSVDRIVESARFDEEAYYHLEWDDEVERRVNSYIDKEGSILNARFREGTWQLEFRFADREQFDAFRDKLGDDGHSFELVSLTTPSKPNQRYQNLTPGQREALHLAAENGYFRVPRETTLPKLADRFDVSHQAYSELLRRGMENLVFSTLTLDQPPDAERE